MFILLGMPVVQIVIFGFALSNEVKNANIAILDNSKDAATASLSAQLDASRYFALEKNLVTYKQVEEEFKRGKIKLAIVFPQHFGEDLQHFNKAQVQIIADAADPNTATQLTNYATSIIMDYQDRITNERKLPYTINTEMRMLYNPQLKGAFNFVPGVLAMVLLLVCTMMTAITIVKEKEMGTMEVMLVSPMRPQLVVLAKAVPYLLLSTINITSILLLSVLIADSITAKFLYTCIIIAGFIDFFQCSIAANRHVHFISGTFSPNNYAQWFYVSRREYAVTIAYPFEYCACKMVLHHCEIGHDKGPWYSRGLEGNTDTGRHDVILFNNGH